MTQVGGSTETEKLVFEKSNKGHVVCQIDKSQKRVVIRDLIRVGRKQNWRKNASLGDSAM